MYAVKTKASVRRKRTAKRPAGSPLIVTICALQVGRLKISAQKVKQQASRLSDWPSKAVGEEVGASCAGPARLVRGSAGPRRDHRGQWQGSGLAGQRARCIGPGQDHAHRASARPTLPGCRVLKRVGRRC